MEEVAGDCRRTRTFQSLFKVKADKYEPDDPSTQEVNSEVQAAGGCQ
jgi:hypothetical protein